MKRTFSALVISGALLCTLAVPGMAAEAEGQPGDSAAASAPQAQTLPASVLYFGQVTQVVRDEAGTVTRLVLSSERYGEYIMNISSDTVWIDSGNRTVEISDIHPRQRTRRQTNQNKQGGLEMRLHQVQGVTQPTGDDQHG